MTVNPAAKATKATMRTALESQEGGFHLGKEVSAEQGTNPGLPHPR